MIDFGGSFKALEPPENLGIPESYCSPEFIFEQSLEPGTSIRCDLWALGCTLFEIRTGRRLFGAVMGDMDDQLCLMVDMFGAFPKKWWDA